MVNIFLKLSRAYNHCISKQRKHIGPEVVYDQFMVDTVTFLQCTYFKSSENVSFNLSGFTMTHHNKSI